MSGRGAVRGRDVLTILDAGDGAGQRWICRAVRPGNVVSGYRERHLVDSDRAILDGYRVVAQLVRRINKHRT